jgi:hypothetical protein
MKNATFDCIVGGEVTWGADCSFLFFTKLNRFLLLFIITNNNKKTTLTTTKMSGFAMPTNTANVTGRSAERKEAIYRRREKKLLAENAALREALERKEQKMQDLCAKFGLANTRISVLTSSLMDSLHTQWENIVRHDFDLPAAEGACHAALRQQIQVIHEHMGEDNNEYAQARLIELLIHLNGE